jgi:uncharacterized membrane protein (DUF106 family)
MLNETGKFIMGAIVCLIAIIICIIDLIQSEIKMRRLKKWRKEKQKEIEERERNRKEVKDDCIAIILKKEDYFIRWY